jgi:hypothetical protein
MASVDGELGVAGAKSIAGAGSSAGSRWSKGVGLTVLSMFSLSRTQPFSPFRRYTPVVSIAIHGCHEMACETTHCHTRLLFICGRSCHEIAAQATIKIRRYCFVLKGDEHAYGIEC